MEDIIIRLKRDFLLVFKHIKETLKRYKNISYRLVTIEDLDTGSQAISINVGEAALT